MGSDGPINTAGETAPIEGDRTRFFRRFASLTARGTRLEQPLRRIQVIVL